MRSRVIRLISIGLISVYSFTCVGANSIGYRAISLLSMAGAWAQASDDLADGEDQAVDRKKFEAQTNLKIDEAIKLVEQHPVSDEQLEKQSQANARDSAHAIQAKIRNWSDAKAERRLGKVRRKAASLPTSEAKTRIFSILDSNASVKEKLLKIYSDEAFASVQKNIVAKVHKAGGIREFLKQTKLAANTKETGTNRKIAQDATTGDKVALGIVIGLAALAAIACILILILGPAAWAGTAGGILGVEGFMGFMVLIFVASCEG